MARQKSNGVTWRCNLTVPEQVAERLRRYAASVDRTPTTAAAELMVAGLDAATRGEGDDLADLRRRNQELHRQNDDLRRAQEDLGTKLAKRGDRKEREPRWEWPVEELLADRQWWDRWLPRLYELLGRTDPFDVDTPAPADSRGYSDVMSRLFPAAGSVTWRSPNYGAAVASMAADGAHEGRQPPVHTKLWEPVIRHVALALSALEDTGQPGASPHLRLETIARLTNLWVQVLLTIVGQETARLPRPIR